MLTYCSSDVSYEALATTAAITTQPVNEAYTEASADIDQETMAPPLEVYTEMYTEMYTETYTDVYTEKYTEVFRARPEIYTEIFTEVYPAFTETYGEAFTDVYEDVYQNEYRDQAVAKHPEGDSGVTPGNRETTEKRDENDAVHQSGLDPSKGMAIYLINYRSANFLKSLNLNFARPLSIM